MTGEYLARQVRHRAIGPISAFREYVFDNVVPHFSNLEQRADRISNEYYEHAVSQPADEDFDGDLSNFAEDAGDHALNWYGMMRSLRQTMLNLLAAGLFHLTEQQLAIIGQETGFEDRQPKHTKLDVVAEWYNSTLRMDLKRLPGWSLIDELRHVANTVKHAEPASKSLRTLRPDLFSDPTLADLCVASGIEDHSSITDHCMNRHISAPLAGRDLFVTEGALRQYAEGVEKFFREIAAHFETTADECY